MYVYQAKKKNTNTKKKPLTWFFPFVGLVDLFYLFSTTSCASILWFWARERMVNSVFYEPDENYYWKTHKIRERNYLISSATLLYSQVSGTNIHSLPFPYPHTTELYRQVCLLFNCLPREYTLHFTAQRVSRISHLLLEYYGGW